MAIELKTIQAGLLGLGVGDALGVPVEFTSRAERDAEPVTTMQGWGTYRQPPGTWSDDSSLAFCLAETLTEGSWEQTEMLQTTGDRFVQWYEMDYWTPHGVCFDIGNTTRMAIARLAQGINPMKAGETGDRSNGNGSLMRILPIAFCHELWDWSELLDRTHQLSCLTHAHPRSQIACGFYVSIAMDLIQGASLGRAYLQSIERVKADYQQPPFDAELPHFQRLLDGAIATLPREEIQSTGYVIHTFEASLWCLLTTNSYAEAVLKAVNLGDDTDTTGAVVGGLAGLYYGLDGIPTEWRSQLAQVEKIMDLGVRLQGAIAAYPENPIL